MGGGRRLQAGSGRRKRNDCSAILGSFSSFLIDLDLFLSYNKSNAQRDQVAILSLLASGKSEDNWGHTGGKNMTDEEMLRETE